MNDDTKNLGSSINPLVEGLPTWMCFHHKKFQFPHFGSKD